MADAFTPSFVDLVRAAIRLRIAARSAGETGTFETATPYHTFVSDAGDTDRPKIVIRDQNASVRLVYYPL